MNELVIPPAALRDKGAIEMIRAWIAENGLHCSISVGVYKDTDVSEVRAWGILLADVTRHVSDALVKNGQALSSSVEGIKKSYLQELAKPTSKTEGDFADS